jgi:hypothetical protein
MRNKNQKTIVLTAVALVLCVLQAGIWIRATEHARTLTALQNKEGQQPSTDIPGVAGLCLLIAAGVVASMPSPETRQ